jgi:phosphate transport system substrate-binding protein
MTGEARLCQRCGAPLTADAIARQACTFCAFPVAAAGSPAAPPAPPAGELDPQQRALLAAAYVAGQRAGAARPRRSALGCAVVLVALAGIFVAGIVALAFLGSRSGGNAATAGATSSPAAALVPSDANVVLRMSGSSTIGSVLAPKLALAYLAKRGATDAREIDDKGGGRIVVLGTVGGQLVAVTIDYPGTAAAFDGLASDTCDLGLASRAIQPSEVAKLASLGDMHSTAAEHVLAMDGIAVIVSPSNRVARLTVDQVAGIFLGSTSDWAQAGGSAGAIHVLSRDKKSGTYETFVQMVLHGKDIPPSRGPILTDNDAVAAGVAADPLAIGFVGLPYVGKTKALAIQDGDATPLAPSFFSVGTEDYALSRRLYLYSAPRPKSDWVKAFVEFAIGEEGQRVVAQVGFVSLNVNASDTTAPADAPPAYARLTRGAKRLSFDFRFESGGTALDGKALADLARMTSYLRSSRPSTVALLGFADSQGAEPANVQLSKHRAQTVADELTKLGFPAHVVEGLGSAMPVAPNSTAEGRTRNRRVEVWVR